jgi:hypothetical protein
MGKIVFLLEERSMKTLLDGLLPRLFPNLQFFCIPHEGKQDLEKSIPRKMRAWREPGVRFMVVRDNDNADCESLKASLQALCSKCGRSDSLIRLACQELEAWYFGEPEALAKAYYRQELGKLGQKSRYRDPDSIHKPSNELSRLIPEFQKVSGARLMSASLSGQNNSSRSFRAFCRAVLMMQTIQN